MGSQGFARDFMYHARSNSGPGMPQAMRMLELIDQFRSEYEGLVLETSRMKQLNDDYERKIEQQINEVESIQRTLFELQTNQSTIKQKYEEEIMRLRRQLEHSGDRGGDPSAKRLKTDVELPSLNTTTPGDLMRGTLPSLSSAVKPLSGSALPPTSAAAPSSTSKLDSLSDLSRLAEFRADASKSNTSLAPLNLPRSSSPGIPEVAPALPPVKPEEPALPAAAAAPAATSLPNIKPPQADADVEMSTKEAEPRVEQSDDSDAELQRRKAAEEKADAPDWQQIPSGNEISLQKTIEHQSVVCCVRFSTDGKLLATGSNKVAQVFDSEKGDLVTSFSTEVEGDSEADSYVRSVCFSPDSTSLVAGAEDKTIKLWDLREKRLMQTFAGHEMEIYSLDYSPDSRLIVSGSGDHKAKVWSVESAACLHELGADGPNQHMDGVTSVCFSPDGEHVATGSLDKIVRLWNINTGQFVHAFDGHREPVYSVVFSPDGKSLATGSLDKTLKLWDVKSAECRQTFSKHNDYVLSVSFAKNGEWLVSGSKDRTVAFWDPRLSGETVEPRLALQGHRNSVISVGMSPTEARFATGSGDSRARMWTYSL